MKIVTRWLPLLLALVLLPSCGDSKKAAEAALAQAQMAYDAIAAQARSLAPDPAQEIEAGLTSAHADLAKGDGAAVLKEAKDLQSRIQTLAEQLPGLQQQLEGDWKELLVSVPGSLSALDKKIAGFGKPPAGMPGRATFDAAKTTLAGLRTKWDECQALATGGKLARAVGEAQQVKDDAVKTLAGFQTGS